jgi:hypothetical protein
MRRQRAKRPRKATISQLTCKRGHPWTAENTRIRSNGRRECRACARLRRRGRPRKPTPARREYRQTYYQKNRDKLLAQVRAWREANRERSRELVRQWRKANPDKQRAAEKRWRKANPEKVQARVRRRRQWLDGIKRAFGCIDCRMTTGPLHFHHRDRVTKKFTISDKVGSSKRQLLDEIAKCDVLCPPCHQKRHAVEHAAKKKEQSA